MLFKITALAVKLRRYHGRKSVEIHKSTMDKFVGVSIIFLNDKDEILLILRDNNPSIPFPNMWGLPGGHANPNESPGKCAKREIKEELGVLLKKLKQVGRFSCKGGYKIAYWTPAKIDINKIVLNEGQRLASFSYDTIKTMKLAFEASEMIKVFICHYYDCIQGISKEVKNRMYPYRQD